jgi:hypothetical protein
MIVKPTKPLEEYVSVNIGRPSFFYDIEKEYWRGFQEFVKTCDIPIVVNGFYFTIDGMLEDDESYSGGGFKYMFWFESEEDKSIFMKYPQLIDVDEKLKQCRDMVAKMAEDLCSVQPMPSTIMKDLIDSADKRTKEQLIADGYEPVDPVSNMPLMWIKKDMVYKE